MHRHVKHMLTVLGLVIFVTVYQHLSALNRSYGHLENGDRDPTTECHTIIQILLHIVRLLSLLPLPYNVASFLSFVCLHTHPGTPKLRENVIVSKLPWIYFRVVTKGTYPDFVKHNVRRNQMICDRFGLTQYIIEVVTDNALQLTLGPHVREVVVPEKYRPPKGALFKARALHYCLQHGVSDVTAQDWLVHLDEETILTESALIGILNFIGEGRWDLGQGCITYANEQVECWLTTMADSARVGVDFGVFRFALHVLHAPVFAWKGSFIVARAGVEAAVGFDFGPQGSLAEDCCFALRAWGTRGRRFGWVEGEMWEQSTFSVGDYLRQRKRWMQGLMLVLLDSAIPPYCKLGVAGIVIGWPLAPTSLVISLICPLPLPPTLAILAAFIAAVMCFTYAFGAYKSFAHRCRASKAMHLLLCLCSMLVGPIMVCLELIAFLWAAVGFRRSLDFHLVKKEPRGTVIHV